jgi:pimeloyl-CoA synthetase
MFQIKDFMEWKIEWSKENTEYAENLKSATEKTAKKNAEAEAKEKLLQEEAKIQAIRNAKVCCNCML